MREVALSPPNTVNPEMLTLRVASTLAAAVVVIGLCVCSPAMPANTGHSTTSPRPHLTFEELRARPLRLPHLAPRSPCPVSSEATVRFETVSVSAHGRWPFYFGPWGLPIDSGDLTKTPWHVAADYTGRLVVRGQRVDGPGQLAFGFWPYGYGTPAAAPDVSVLFTRPDQLGRTVVYQGELDVDTAFGHRDDGHFWSYPSAGCYMVQADGDGFTNVTTVLVGR